jgi:hypothetical protein
MGNLDSGSQAQIADKYAQSAPEQQQQQVPMPQQMAAGMPQGGMQ